MIADKRKFRRKKIQLKVTCHASEGSLAKLETQSFNISQSGIVLRVKKHFTGRRATLMITNPYWKEPILAKCRVVWESGIPRTDEKKIGLEFSEVSWSRINQLLGLIKD
jgi:c-di-GMP-binding flagellar brake protein YcgR